MKNYIFNAAEGDSQWNIVPESLEQNQLLNARGC